MSQFWQPTAQIFQKFIETPKMVQKLLIKPPFKYVRDIFISLCKQTGYGQGLYSQYELETAHEDKQSKIKFYQKLIKLVRLTSSQPFDINPKNIVAGINPEETNIFLQILGNQALKYEYESCQKCVQMVLGEYNQEKHINDISKYVLNAKYKQVSDAAPQIPVCKHKKVIFVVSEANEKEVNYWAEKLKKQKFVVEFRFSEDKQNSVKQADEDETF